MSVNVNDMQDEEGVDYSKVEPSADHFAPPRGLQCYLVHLLQPVMGESKSRFERFLGMIRQILGLIRHERLGFDSIRYFLPFDSKRGIRQPNLSQLSVPFSVYNLLLFWVIKSKSTITSNFHRHYFTDMFAWMV